MRRIMFSLLAVAALAAGADKSAPRGHGEDESVAIDATVLSQEQVTQEVGSNFGGVYTVLEVHVTPKGDKPYDVRLDDFILRSEASGEHSGPMPAGQVAGAGEMVVKRSYGARATADEPAMLDGMKVQMEDLGTGAHLEAVKKKVLAEQTTAGAQSGLLFFPLEKEKPKNLELTCTTPQGKLRIRFK